MNESKYISCFTGRIKNKPYEPYLPRVPIEDVENKLKKFMELNEFYIKPELMNDTTIQDLFLDKNCCSNRISIKYKNYLAVHICIKVNKGIKDDLFVYNIINNIQVIKNYENCYCELYCHYKNAKWLKIKSIIDSFGDKYKPSDESDNLYLKYIYKYFGSYYKNRRNYKEMKKYYKMAIDLQNDQAMHGLADYYEGKSKKNSDPKYITKLTVNYTNAILLGNIRAMLDFAYYYEIMGNYKEMKKYSKMAIAKGYLLANYQLGAYYYNKRKFEKMKEYLVPAADDKVALACFLLGHYYYNVEKNIDLGVEYFVKAIKINNYIKAIEHLAYHYEQTENVDKMLYYYEKATLQDSVFACEKLYTYYTKVAPDTVMAHRYLSMIKLIEAKIKINKEVSEIIYGKMA
jgi:hypothetical protein